MSRKKEISLLRLLQQNWSLITLRKEQHKTLFLWQNKHCFNHLFVCTHEDVWINWVVQASTISSAWRRTLVSSLLSNFNWSEVGHTWIERTLIPVVAMNRTLQEPLRVNKVSLCNSGGNDYFSIIDNVIYCTVFQSKPYFQYFTY